MVNSTIVHITITDIFKIITTTTKKDQKEILPNKTTWIAPIWVAMSAKAQSCRTKY